MNRENEPSELKTDPVATIVIAEIGGLVHLSDVKDAKGEQSLIGGLYDRITQEIRLYDGTIYPSMGERIMAVFGLENRVENDEKNAVNAALRFHAVLESFSNDHDLAFPLSVRVGIHTGPVIKTRMGAGSNIQESLIGETVDIAARIQDIADKNQVLVGSITYEKTKDIFAYHALEPVPVKGYKKPLAIYEVTVKKSEPTAPPLQSGRIITSQMVGRQKDLKIIEDAVKQLLNGRGGVVNIEGIAGIGKSRLMAEVREKEIMHNVAFFEGRALSEGKNLSFHPIIQIIKSWSGIKEDDNPALSYQKLSANITRIYSGQASEIIPFVATMMGYPLEGEAKQRVKGIEGEALERLILKNTRDLLARAASIRPIVILVEDAHWADLSSISFMESFFKLSKIHRILFINVFRPGYKETGERLKVFVKENLPDHFREIIINPLTETESSELISNLLNQTKLPDDIRQLIVKRSEGNPFFIEEVLRSFIDEGLIEIKDGIFIITDRVQYANIPETIDKVILSRIDRLDEKTKGLLRTASVIGRNFYYKVLEEAAQTIEELDTRLQYLKETQLLSEHRQKEEVEFLFKHALAQQATYDSILQKTKKELHLKIAKSIEKVFADKLPEFYGVLAMHYDKAEVIDKKQEYLIKAGDESFSSGASNEAMNFYMEAVKLFPKEPQDELEKENQKELEIKVGFAQEAAGNNIVAIETFSRVFYKYYGHQFPTSVLANKFLAIYSLLSIMFKINLHTFYFRKHPDEDFDIYMKVVLQLGEALSTINPSRWFVHTTFFLNKLIGYDISKSIAGLSAFSIASTLFMWTGLSFSMSKKILDYAQRAKVEDYPGSLNDYKYARKMHDYFTGNIEDENDFEHVYQQGMRSGKFFAMAIYTLYSGLSITELGKYARFEELVQKLAEISESFDNSHAQAQLYRLSVMSHYRFRKIDFALKMAETGITYTEKTGHFAMLLVIWCAKSLVHTTKNEMEAAKESLAEAAKLVKDRKIITIFHIPYVQAKAQVEFQELKMAIERKEKPGKNAKTLSKTIDLMISLSKKMRSAATEAYRLKAITCWMLGRQRQAYKNFTLSIKSGQKYNCHLELSRTYFETGKCLRETNSIKSSLLGINGSEYLLMAKRMFEEMDLQWDLKEYEKYMDSHLK